MFIIVSDSMPSYRHHHSYPPFDPTYAAEWGPFGYNPGFGGYHHRPHFHPHRHPHFAPHGNYYSHFAAPQGDYYGHFTVPEDVYDEDHTLIPTIDLAAASAIPSSLNKHPATDVAKFVDFFTQQLAHYSSLHEKQAEQRKDTESAGDKPAPADKAPAEDTEPSCKAKRGRGCHGSRREKPLEGHPFAQFLNQAAQAAAHVQANGSASAASGENPLAGIFGLANQILEAQTQANPNQPNWFSFAQDFLSQAAQQAEASSSKGKEPLHPSAQPHKTAPQSQEEQDADLARAIAESLKDQQDVEQTAKSGESSEQNKTQEKGTGPSMIEKLHESSGSEPLVIPVAEDNGSQAGSSSSHGDEKEWTKLQD
ncbi:hypothetical protein HDV03_002664 [Kappamyces sp. JEL0829]|nr:hypothetical protein HDV03_002664 [Kappamyces sp. JEL0829]